MQVDLGWCRVHGERATALYDGVTRRCDAPGHHGRIFCDLRLEPLAASAAVRDEEGGSDVGDD